MGQVGHSERDSLSAMWHRAKEINDMSCLSCPYNNIRKREKYKHFLFPCDLWALTILPSFDMNLWYNYKKGKRSFTTTINNW